jgi:hypothetical protein
MQDNVQPQCGHLDGQCTGESCGDRGDPREPIHHGPEHGLRVSFVDETLMSFGLVQWPDEQPQLTLSADGTWPTLSLAQTDELLLALDEYAGALRVARGHLVRALAAQDAQDATEDAQDGQDASVDAPLMRVDAPQVSESGRVHVIPLLDAPGATLTVTCPEWCVSDHADEETRGTLAADFTHKGEELVLPSPSADDEPLMSARIEHGPFSHCLRTPVMGVWPAAGDMGPDQVHAFAEQLRAFADALDCLSVDLDDARLTARAERLDALDARGGDR